MADRARLLIGPPSPVVVPPMGTLAGISGVGMPPPGSPMVPGNIDLYNRPEVPNRGGLSTVYSASFNIDGREVLLPLADDGRILTDDEAVRKYIRTGKHLGMFRTPAEASRFAEQLHHDYEAGKYRRPRAK